MDESKRLPSPRDAQLPATQPNVILTADPAAIAAAEEVKAVISAQFTYAMMNPRDEDEARANIIKACQRPMFAARAEYGKPISGKTIVGPSIRFAELALREWGNLRCESSVIYDDKESRRIKITIIELQTNTTFTKQIEIGKTVERKYANDREVLATRKNSGGKDVHIVRATEEEMYVKEAAWISKVLRNEGLRLIPSDVIDEAIHTARDTVMRADAKDPDGAKKKILDCFLSLNVKPSDIKELLGHPVDKLTLDELKELRRIYSAMIEGAPWSDFIGATGTNTGAKNATQQRSDELQTELDEAGAGTVDADESPAEIESAPVNPFDTVEELDAATKELATGKNTTIQKRYVNASRSGDEATIATLYNELKKMEETE